MRTAFEEAARFQGMIERARKLVVEAIAVLDEGEAPAVIAAHLDLAVHRMSDPQTGSTSSLTATVAGGLGQQQVSAQRLAYLRSFIAASSELYGGR